MPTLLWLRRDLRLHDQPPLLEAGTQSAETLACFVLDPRLEASAGPRRLQFLGDSLRDLREQLDGRLYVTRAAPSNGFRPSPGRSARRRSTSPRTSRRSAGCATTRCDTPSARWR